MAYLRNRTVNLLNLHYGIHALVVSGAGAFFAAYLLRAGVPAPTIFTSIALILAVRFCIRPSVLVLARRYGLRATVIIGTIASAVQYPVLAEVRGVDLMLLAFCIAGAIGDTFYWTSYHAYFAALGDAEHRGHQLGAREALAAVAAIAGPLLCAWALTALGPRVAFGAAAIVQALAALPLLGTPDVAVKPSVPGVFRAALPAILMFVADGWIAAGVYYVWAIALFVSLSENYTAFGGALALAGLVGAISGLLLGRHIDAGHGNRAVWVAYGGFAALTVFRALSTGSVALAVAANALGALITCLCAPTMMTAVYNLAKGSPCTLRFHIATEGGWDLGGGSGCLLAAALSASGLPLSVAILPALAGIALSIHLLRRYYAHGTQRSPAPAIEAAPGA